MRREDKELKDKKIVDKILQKAQICRLALCLDSYPYLVPLNFVYFDNAIYIHSANKGKKIDILSKNENVCFQIDIDTKLDIKSPICKSTMQYKSVIGFGKACVLEDFEKKKKAMHLLIEKYSHQKATENLDPAIKNLCIIKISIDSITAKESN